VGFTEAIAKSCDVFFYRLGQRLGPDTLARYARRMGLGARSGLDIAGGEVAGVVPDPAWKRRRGLGPWVGGDTVDYGIGQAMLACTPMQICAAISAIANDGTLFVPQVVASLTTYGDGGVTRTQPVVSKVARRLGATPQTLAAVRRGMEAVVSAGGTGTRCAIPGVRVAGKTGTAERRARGDRVNDAWFAGFAPADRPRIAVCVYVEEGGHGGETAAPIARAVMARYLGVDAGAETTSGRSDD
jgi:penicillin-binding protein 2